VHQPTSLPSLDEYTNGGIVYGSRVYLMGAPDAGKTALLIQLAHQYASEGICVGLLAVDEEPGDVVTRFAQREGWERSDCEVREARTLEHMAEELDKLPIRFYGDEHTIESAAEDLATWAATLGKRAFFGIDSIQTVTSEAGVDADGPREFVTANVRAVRTVTTRHRLLTVATSEMGRGSYRNQQQALQQDDMAAGKESGAIEYSARVLLALRTVKGQPGLVNCKVVKNKLGQSQVEFHMNIDKRRQLLTECSGPEEVEQAAHPHLADDCAVLLAHIASKGSIAGQRGTRAFFATLKIGRVRADMALDVLIESDQVGNAGSKQQPKCILKT
jgi:KaiC/GvpD/RAD55 family RecA-like ATPase